MTEPQGILKAREPTETDVSEFFTQEDLRDATAFQRPAEEEDPEAAGQEDDYDDPDGALWSGPAARSVPTSVSGFRMRARSRGELDRHSREYERQDDGDDARSQSRRRRRSSRRGPGGGGADTDTETLRSRKSRRARSRRSSRRDSDASSDTSEVGFFEGLSNVFRGRRPASVYSRVVDDDAVSLTSERTEDDDPYGPYGSTSEESASDESTSSNERGGGFPGISSGGDFFGSGGAHESRISMDEDEMSSLSESSDEGGEERMCHQLVYIVDEDLPLRFVGLHLCRSWLFLWYFGCVVTAGGLWLVGRWLPNLWRKATGEMEIFAESDYVVVEVSVRLYRVLRGS